MPRTLQTKTKTPKLSKGLKNNPDKGSTSTKILKNKKDTTQNGKANGRILRKDDEKVFEVKLPLLKTNKMNWH
jgi:hypothetical protein